MRGLDQTSRGGYAWRRDILIALMTVTLASCIRSPMTQVQYVFTAEQSRACPLWLPGNQGCRVASPFPVRVSRVTNYGYPQSSYIGGVSCDTDLCVEREGGKLLLAFPMGLSAWDQGVHHVTIRHLEGYSAIILSTRAQGDACYLPQELKSASSRERLCSDSPEITS